MLVKFKIKFSLILFFALIISAKYNVAYAIHDVVKAKTIRNENIIEKKYDDKLYTEEETDMDLPNYDSKKTLGAFLHKKLNKVLKTNRADQEISQENIRENQENREISQENIKENQEFSQEDSTENNIKNDEQKFIPYKEQEIVENHKFQINADKVSYDDEEGNVYANGNVEIIAHAQDVTLKADEAVLDKASQTLKLKGNVKILKNNTEMIGEFLLVDLNEQNILMDNPTLNAYSFVIKAQEGYLIANDIQMLNGNIKSSKNSDFPLITRGFMRYDNVARDFNFDKKPVNELDVNAKKQSYRIDAKEIIITSYKDHNSVLLKNSDIYFNNHKIIRNSDIEILSDKQKQVIETSVPEAGNLRNFGSYIGYGFAYKMPKGHTLKLMPVVAYQDSDYGIGAIGRYRSPNHILEAGWNTASENWVVRGKYKLANNLMFAYGRNAYLSEGFLGARRSGYAGQFQYAKTYRIKDLDATFNNGVYVGLFSDYAKKHQEDAYSTTRFRYMAEFKKTIKRYTNKDKDFLIGLNAVSQGAATVYGSGETTAIARFGPNISSKYKKWDQSITYLISGTHGESAFRFDRYRYGKSTVMINEKFNVNEKFAFGFRLFVTPMRDNYNDDLFTESRVYFMLGPNDAKVALSYDFVRDVAHLDFMFLLGSDNSTINFDKLSTKDIDGKQEKSDFYKSAKRVVIEKPENI